MSRSRSPAAKHQLSTLLQAPLLNNLESGIALQLDTLEEELAGYVSARRIDQASGVCQTALGLNLDILLRIAPGNVHTVLRQSVREGMRVIVLIQFPLLRSTLHLLSVPPWRYDTDVGLLYRTKQHSQAR
jgi:hypothetical protein